jgi:diadenosine tetraphosphate (Ap4A) HIT family hydrolase
VLLRTPAWRIVRVDDPNYPGFCRVILNKHVREMTDLPQAEQQTLMSVVFAVEQTIRQLYQPDKINLASFGNMVPHVHWHIIPRWINDRHFPEPIWGNVHNEHAIARPQITDEMLTNALSKTFSAHQIDLGRV